MKDLRLKAKTIIEEIIQENLHDFRFSSGFLNVIPKAQVTGKKNR